METGRAEVRAEPADARLLDVEGPREGTPREGGLEDY